jgi:hypothetical protein
MARFSFVHADIDGEGKRWRLAVDAGRCLVLTDEDVTVSRTDVKKHGDQIVGPFTVEQLLAGVKRKRRAQ